MATVTAVPTAGTAKSTVFRFDVAAATSNDTTGYTTTIYPTEPEITYYLAFTASNQETLKSYVFGVNPLDGTHQFNNFIFPAAATWTITLTNASTDASVATTTVVAG